MEFSDKQFFNINLSFLVCSILVLSPNNKLFKKLNLKDDIYLGKNSQDYILNCPEILSPTLNKTSLRKLANTIIESNFLNNFIFSTDITPNTQKDVLKRYLKKYNYLYKQYFFFKRGNYNFKLNDKEINTYAVEFLFMLIGI